MGSPTTEPEVRRAVRHLLSLQCGRGEWEGEMVWCPMITAQYVIVRHVTGRPVVNGVFFGSAMLDYRLYQSYFPTWALARHAASMRDEGVSGARP